MSDAQNTDTASEDIYETPALSDYGSIEEWTQGRLAEAVNVSIILPS